LALCALYERGSSVSVKNDRKGFVTPSSCKLTGANVPLVGYCLAATSGRHTGTDWSRTYVAYFDEARRLTPLECEKLQGFPSGWSLPEKEYPLSDDAIDTLRYHALGNAVCVPVVKWIADRIVLCLSRKDIIFNYVSQSSDSTGLKKVIESFVGFHKSSVQNLYDLQHDANDKGHIIRWGNSGAAYGEWCLEGKSSPAPNIPIEKNLIDIIEKREVEEKYFLSPNAAKGILRRVNGQGRTLFKPLNDALERLSKKL
jgi:DNA (cytosine-5)-methyltransferase 1